MILAFNMYAAIRTRVTYVQNDRVDIIVPVSDRYSHLFMRHVFNKQYCNALYMPDSWLLRMIELVENERNQEFWQYIFYIYNNKCSPYEFSHRVPYSINLPTRIVDQNIDITENQKLANMILQMECSLPNNIIKIIYDTCKALYPA